MLIKRFNLFRGYIVWISENTSFLKFYQCLLYQTFIGISIITDIDTIL